MPFSKGNNTIVGLCGGSGSGKTTILNKLKAEFSALKPTIVSLDNYYRPVETQQKDENGKINFDLPSAIDKERLLSDVQKLLNGESITIKEYAFNYRNGEKVIYVTLQPSSLIFIEGLFVFHYEEIRSMLDFSLFVDADLNVQFNRRLKRDQTKRNYTSEEVQYQWDNHVLPCYEKFLLPYKATSSMVVKNEGDIAVVMSGILLALRQILVV